MFSLVWWAWCIRVKPTQFYFKAHRWHFLARQKEPCSCKYFTALLVRYNMWCRSGWARRERVSLFLMWRNALSLSAFNCLCVCQTDAPKRDKESSVLRREMRTLICVKQIPVDKINITRIWKGKSTFWFNECKISSRFLVGMKSGNCILYAN